MMLKLLHLVILGNPSRRREKDFVRRMYHWNRLRVKERKHISQYGLVFTKQRRVSTSSIQAEATAAVPSVGYAISVQQVLRDVTSKTL